MIRRVRLDNWRAYRRLDLLVNPGVTFLVAANGVGKSSLLEAVRWALSPGVMPSDPTVVRHGHDEAAVTVTLASAQGELVARREMRLRGSRGLSSFHVTLDGRKLEEPAFRQLLAKVWSADVGFVSKSAFLTENLRVSGEEPDLREHLCQVYSLNELKRAIDEIGPALSRAKRAVETARAELTATEQQLDAARRDRDSLEDRLSAARTEVFAARERYSAAQRVAEQIRAAQRVASAAVAWDEQVAVLRQQTEAVAGQATGQALLWETLRQAKLSVREEVEAARTEQTRLSARLESIEEALTSLRASGGQCPVCLRDLDAQGREQAEHIHSESLARVRERLQEVRPNSVTERLDRIEALELQVTALGERPAPARGDSYDNAAELAIAQEDLERAVGALRELEVAARAADQNINRIRAELSEAEQLKLHYREVALFEAAKKALDSTINSVLSEQLAPLISEVNRRWRVVFPDRPNLMLMPDGTMYRDLDGSALGFSAFSAGEKTVAKLMMRITALLATTKVPFCWVDEPLEHLDPRSRHLVGSMLAHLSTTPGLEQVFVTTYEEPLARRLAEFQPDRVRVEYLRAEHVH